MTPPTPPPAWHTLTAAEAAAHLQSDPVQGLTHAEAARRRTRYGPNTLPEARGRSAVAILAAQFRSLIVALLLAAAAIALATGDIVEAASIVVVIGFNAAVGFLTEWKAQGALSALREQAVPIALVVRDGATRELPAAELVPGDVVVLTAGERVPADGRIVESVRLQIEEAALTGESNARFKTAEPIPDAATPIADRVNTAFLGTSITDGRGRMVVTATGARTEVGTIGILIDTAADRTSPLERKLARLGSLLVAVVVGLCTVIVAVGWLRGTAEFWPMLEIGLSLAVAAVPEGLPAVTTMSLAIGMQRMARLRALIRRLSAVETLGSTTVICTDKTGTLTKNEMTVQAFVLAGRRIDVTGTGYAAEGAFLEGDKPMDPGSDDLLALALRIGLLCNDARVQRDGDRAAVLGDPTEAALVVAAEKAGMNPDALANDFPRLGEVPFDSASKRMITVHRTPQGQRLALVKGSPGTMIATCGAQATAGGVAPMTPDDRKGWDEANLRLAGEALRVLALAYRELPEGLAGDDRGDGNRSVSDDSELDANRTDSDLPAYVDLARDLILVSLVGMSDPLRDEAAAAIATCRTAGIRTVMITGDQQPTAAEIARQLGIDRDLDGRALRTVHGRELAHMDTAGWQRAAADAAVFARVSPAHKLRIVEALQQQGHVVAMTGDGVNDAPALKMADIGIAMGIEGTEIAKENADMVITDDNFASIVGAVEQGRIIYGNIIRFIHYLLSCNLSEILTVFLALMLGWPLPMTVLQILWLNLITDIFPAFALALEPSAPDAMKRPPRDPREPLLSPGLMARIGWQGFVLAAVTLVAFRIGMDWHGFAGDGLRRATTMAFMTLALAQVAHAFSARSQSRSTFTRRLFTNGWLWAAVAICVASQIAAVYLPLFQRVLHTVPPTAWEWAVIATCALAPMVLVEVEKGVRRGVRRRPAGMGGSGAARVPR